MVGRVTPCAPFWSGNERRARGDAPYQLAFKISLDTDDQLS